MKTLQLKIVGHDIGRNRGDGEPDAETRLKWLQDLVLAWSKNMDVPSSVRIDMARALLTSQEGEETSQGRSDVEWLLLIDVEDDDIGVNLRTASQSVLASGNHIVLDRGNAEVFPDLVPSIEITAL